MIALGIYSLAYLAFLCAVVKLGACRARGGVVFVASCSSIGEIGWVFCNCLLSWDVICQSGLCMDISRTVSAWRKPAQRRRIFRFASMDHPTPNYPLPPIALLRPWRPIAI